MTKLSLSEIEKAIEEFNADAATLLKRRVMLVENMETAGLGKRFAQKALAYVSVKMPEA